MPNIQDPSYDYDTNRPEYARIRHPDPSIARTIRLALASNKTLINVGAGTGSYEPEDMHVTAIEPSSEMRRARLELGRVPAIRATAQEIPFDDDSFEAALASITIHHWQDLEQGLREVRRVTKGKILILTFDPDRLGCFWNQDYFPELVEVERQRYPALEKVKEILSDENLKITRVPVPLNCTDGFQEAFYGRPEAFLDPAVRKSQSAWGFIGPENEERMIAKLRTDLESGEWDQMNGHLRTQSDLLCGLVLLEFSPAD